MRIVLILTASLLALTIITTILKAMGFCFKNIFFPRKKIREYFNNNQTSYEMAISIILNAAYPFSCFFGSYDAIDAAYKTLPILYRMKYRRLNSEDSILERNSMVCNYYCIERS